MTRSDCAEQGQVEAFPSPFNNDLVAIIQFSSPVLKSGYKPYLILKYSGSILIAHPIVQISMI